MVSQPTSPPLFVESPPLEMAAVHSDCVGSNRTPTTGGAFLTYALERHFISRAQASRISSHAAQKLLSDAEAALQLGILKPIQIECVRALASPLQIAPGYEVVDLIGFGGMGIVYYARQSTLDRMVALKTMSNSMIGDDLAQARFRREAEALGRLRHPNIVSAYDFGQSESHSFLVMEFVDGTDVESWLQENGAVTELQGWSLARQILDGLRHAHGQGVTHRDLKPSNLLLVNAPEGFDGSGGMPMVKIADFGLALQANPSGGDNRLTAAHVAMGSPAYMAPEQLEETELDHRCDIYAFGMTLLHMFVGSSPFGDQSTGQIVAGKLRHETTNVDALLPSHSEKSRWLLKKLLVPNREQRCANYESISSTINELLDVADDMTRPVMLGIQPRSESLSHCPAEPTAPPKRDDVLPFITEADKPTSQVAKAPTVELTRPIVRNTAISGGMLLLGFLATLGTADLFNLFNQDRTDADSFGKQAARSPINGLTDRPQGNGSLQAAASEGWKVEPLIEPEVMTKEDFFPQDTTTTEGEAFQIPQEVIDDIRDSALAEIRREEFERRRANEERRAIREDDRRLPRDNRGPNDPYLPPREDDRGRPPRGDRRGELHPPPLPPPEFDRPGDPRYPLPPPRNGRPPLPQTD